MKSSILCLTLILTLVVFIGSTGAEDQCASHNCLPPNQCKSFAQYGNCPTRGHSCCKEVRPEFRKACRHFGGECVTHQCNQRLIARQALDCGANEVCCILITK
ncbi:uncharacterized protein [Fopius arisanus]|uniref:Carboxypeptidase inhibitor n=1 Tax=Fopius arisanus TaxID=64838 RepID=A0A9R1TQF1_9HYME|nr:PREDICTED: uncharacterized protein LOC105274038 [Fopius arisanus]